MKVVLLNVGPGRRVFYSEVVAPTDEGPEAPARRGFWVRVENWFHRLQGRWRHSTSGPARLGRRVWDWLHERTHPDEILYARLRLAIRLDLDYPSTLTLDEVSDSWVCFLAAGRRRHWPWFILNALLAPVSIPLATIPGPNLIGYWFAYRAIHHLFILIGLRRVRSGLVPTRFHPTDTLNGLFGADPDLGPEVAAERLAALGSNLDEFSEFLRRQGVTWPERAPAVEVGEPL